MANTKPSAAQTNKTTLTIEEILDKKKPMETEVELLIDPEYQTRIRHLEQQKIEVGRNNPTKDISQPGVAKIEKEIDKLWEEAQDYIVTFKFRDIGRKKIDALAREHPPTKEQLDEYKRIGAPGQLEFNVDTFGPALVAAASVEPKISLDQANQMFDEWGAGEVETLFATAFAACRGRASLPKSRKGTVAI